MDVISSISVHFGRFWTILEISEKFPTSEGEISRKSPKFRKSEKKSEKI
jgi:hypothetical protein